MDRTEHKCTEPSPVNQTISLATIKDQLLESLVSMMSEKMSEMLDNMLKQFEEYVGAEACNDSNERIIQDKDVKPQETDMIQNYLEGPNEKAALNLFDKLAAEFSMAIKIGPLVDKKLAKLQRAHNKSAA